MEKAFEGKLMYGFGLAVDKASTLSVHHSGKSYKFLRLDGDTGEATEEFPDPKESISRFFLITNNKFLRKINRQKDDPTSFMVRRTIARHGKKKHVNVEVEQTATHPSPSTCVSVELNHTTKTATIANISVHSFCHLENMSDLMGLIDALLRKVKWTGKVELDDNAFKNEVRVAVHYMRTRKGDKFSKYQDYGFKVNPKSLPELRRIKKNVLALTDKAATRRYDGQLSMLLSRMTRKRKSV